MLTGLVAHAGRARAAHDLWAMWSPDPVALLALLASAGLYLRGRARHGSDRRFALGMLAVASALLSPLDELSGSLASAHMVQHVVLMLVAAPLLASSGALTTIVRGIPRPLRIAAARARGRVGRTRRRLGSVSLPLAVSLGHVAVVWMWHSAALYDAALRHPPLHALEHAMFFVSAVLFWQVVVASPRARAIVPGARVLLVFAMTMQSVFLSLLLTFAQAPWYASYLSSAPMWGIEPLADQQLAGVIMWIPGGVVYVAVAIGLVAGWLRQLERAPDAAVAERPGTRV